jgi:hypothetical protein
MNKIKNLTKKNSRSSGVDWQEIWQLVRENEQRSKETDRKFQETDRKFQETDRIVKENAISLKETGRLIQETRISIQETGQQIKDLGKQIGGVSNSNGDVAESYFINSFENNLHFAGQDYDSFMSNLRKKNKKINLQGEYDLVLYNCSSIAIIEIKYNAEKEDVKQAIKKPDTFKKLFPEYKDYAIYLGLAGLHIDERAEKEAIKQGIGVIKQVGDNMVINDAHLKVF